MWVKDSKRKNGIRERIVHNVKFTYVGSNTFIPDFQDYLVSKLGFTKTKINYSRAKEDHHYGIFEYSGRKNLKKFYDYIYKDAILYCKQKKDKFEEIFSALNEKSLSETELIAGTPEMVISSQVSSNEVEDSSTTPEMVVEASASESSALSE